MDYMRVVYTHLRMEFVSSSLKPGERNKHGYAGGRADN